MTDRERQEAHFCEIALEHIQGRDITIDEMLELYESQGFFSEDEERELLLDAKKEKLRRLARKPFRSEDGEVHLIVNVVRGERAPDGRQQVFEFLHDAPKEDLEWLARYHIKRVRQASSKVELVIAEYARRFGKEAARQLRLDLDWPAPTARARA